MRNFDANDQQFDLQEDEVILSFSPEVNVRKEIRNAVFNALGVLDVIVDGDKLVVSKDELDRIKLKVSSKFSDIEFVEIEKQKIEIRIKQTQEAVRLEALEHVSGEYYEHWEKRQWASFGADISTCIGLAIEVNTPKGKAKRPKWRVWFNKDTRYFEYRGERLSWRGEDVKLITLKTLREWKKEVNKRK